MKQINTFTDATDQQMTITLDDGSTVQLEFIYRAGVQRWFVDVIHPSIPGGSLRGYGVSIGPNILRPWRNLIPFGMLVQALDFIDPIQATDFQSGRVLVYILSAAEVQTIEQTIYAPIALANP